MPLLALGLLLGCSPALDWREVRPQGSAAAVLLPCKPDSHTRSVALAGAQVQLTLVACAAGGSTWALAFADIGDPALVGAALTELHDSALRNLGAEQSRRMPLALDGATPNDASRRVQLTGRLPDGRAVTEQLALFSKGTKVFQATVLGEKLAAEPAETFFGGLRLLP
jgi:hypothetical protein